MSSYININKFCHLNKALYGLKQSPKCWNDTLCKCLKDLGFVESNGDPCVFVRNDDLCFLGIYVDDLIIVSPSDEIVIDIKKEIRSKFNMKDLGTLNYFLGVKDVRNSER